MTDLMNDGKPNEWLLCRTGVDAPLARISRADGWFAKSVGVLRFDSLPPGVGLWLPGVASVHTLFVRFSLDLIFLDADFRAVKLARAVPPNRLLVKASGARHVIEMGAGTLTGGERVGESWELQPKTEAEVIKQRPRSNPAEGKCNERD